MIPKIIHLCWLSGDAFPDSIVRCLDTWNEKLTDYEIWLWGKKPEDCSCIDNLHLTEMHFEIDSTPWTKQAYEAKKYAFAADYIRLYAFYNYGGIYLDADVLIYKNFNELLNLPYFIGCDQIRAFEAAVIGAEKGCLWIKDILDTYNGKCFVKKDGTYDVTELPVRFHHELTRLNYTFTRINDIAKRKRIISITHLRWPFHARNQEFCRIQFQEPNARRIRSIIKTGTDAVPRFRVPHFSKPIAIGRSLLHIGHATQFWNSELFRIRRILS